MSYQTKFALLDAVVLPENRKKLIDRDRAITEVAVMIMPAGGSVVLYFGPTADPVAIDGPIAFQPEGDEQLNGLFYSNPTALAAGIGVNIIVAAKTGRVKVDR